jgi:hypothetical protein
MQLSRSVRCEAASDLKEETDMVRPGSRLWSHCQFRSLADEILDNVVAMYLSKCGDYSEADKVPRITACYSVLFQSVAVAVLQVGLRMKDMAIISQDVAR